MAENRRDFLKKSALIGAGVVTAGSITGLLGSCSSDKMFFDISLAEWSLHRELFAGKIKNIDFPRIAKEKYGIHAVEYVSTFFKDEVENPDYIKKLKNLTKELGVRNVLIMVDGEGALGDNDEKARDQAVKNHYKWVKVAKELGCHSIRVNARGNGSAEEVAANAVDGLKKLTKYARDFDIGVIVENHGGYSSNGTWLSGVMKEVNMPGCGTLPDFGNFRISKDEEYDRYKGVKELMPFAKGVSAKTHDFDAEGNEIHTDYYKMMKIVKDAGYRGYVGIEYEGGKISEHEGILATKALLEKVGKEI